MENKEELSKITKKLLKISKKLKKSMQSFKNGDIIRNNNCVIQINNFQTGSGYGFKNNLKWVENGKFNFKTHPDNWKIVSKSEWLQLLKKEAIKRNLVSGVLIQSLFTSKYNSEAEGEPYFIDHKLYISGIRYNLLLMENGKWTNTITNLTYTSNKIIGVEEKSISNIVLPDGVYKGVWGKYTIDITINNNKRYELYTEEYMCNRNVMVVVTVKDGIPTFEKIDNN